MAACGGARIGAALATPPAALSGSHNEGPRLCRGIVTGLQSANGKCFRFGIDNLVVPAAHQNEIRCCIALLLRLVRVVSGAAGIQRSNVADLSGHRSTAFRNRRGTPWECTLIFRARKQSLYGWQRRCGHKGDRRNLI